VIFIGASIEKLCEAVFEDSINDRASVIRAARCLLNSVTRVLLLADVVVVKQLISVKDKVRILKTTFECEFIYICMQGKYYILIYINIISI
jgi:hypothetical protein